MEERNPSTQGVCYHCYYFNLNLIRSRSEAEIQEQLTVKRSNVSPVALVSIDLDLNDVSVAYSSCDLGLVACSL